MSFDLKNDAVRNGNKNRIFILFPAVIFFLLTLGFLIIGSWYTINETERGIILRNGALVGTAEPGLHFKLPLIDEVKRFDITQQALTWSEDNHLQAYSLDQQPASISVSVIYQVPASEVENLYRQYNSLQGLEARLIARNLPQDLKTVFGRYTAKSVIENRARFVSDVEAAVKASIQGPVLINQVNVEDIAFS